jgi:hypothetical protein
MLHVTAPQLISSQCHNCNSTSTNHDWTTSHDAAFLQSISGVEIMPCPPSLHHQCSPLLCCCPRPGTDLQGYKGRCRHNGEEPVTGLLLNLWSASDELAQHPANIITGVQRAIRGMTNASCMMPPKGARIDCSQHAWHHITLVHWQYAQPFLFKATAFNGRLLLCPKPRTAHGQSNVTAQNSPPYSPGPPCMCSKPTHRS